MKSYKIIAALALMVMFAGCRGEQTPEPKWEFEGPIPAITDGPSEAQKMCYQLYTKYDLHVYYNLSGIEAGRTALGYVQTNRIISANKKALPFVAADEEPAVMFLRLLSGFCSLLPQDMVSRGLHRRQVLVKVNPAPTAIKDEAGNSFMSCAHTEDQIGLILYGYLMNEEDDQNTLELDPVGWKWNICYNFFRGQIYVLYKGNVGFPTDFELISKGLYYYDNFTQPALRFYNGSRRVYNRPIAKECGFVHPFGGINSWDGNPSADWGSYVAWILTTTYEEREADIQQWPRIQAKYDIVMDYYRTRYGIDLEQLSKDYLAL